jgi:hypothetical protein
MKYTSLFRLWSIVIPILYAVNTYSQTGTIEPSIQTIDPPIFISGVTGFANTLTIDGEPAGTQTIWICFMDSDDETIDSIEADYDGSEWSAELDMGELDSETAYLEAHYYDSSDDLIDISEPYEITMIEEPEAVSSEIMEINVDSIDDQGIAYMEFILTLPDSSGEIDNNIVGIGEKEFGFEESELVIVREYDINSGDLSGDGLFYRYQIVAFGKEVSSDEIDLTNADITVTIDNDFNPTIVGHYSASKEFFNYETKDATIPLPITPASIAIGAGISVSGGITSDCYLGIDNNGDFGFTEGPNGELSHVSIGAKMQGSIRATGSLFSKHLAGIRASLKATGSIGASSEYQTLPNEENNFHFGGNLVVTGTVQLTGLAGGVKQAFCSWNPFIKCEPTNTVLDGIVWPYSDGQPKEFGDGLPNGLDTLLSGITISYNLNYRSGEVDSDYVLNIPDANPQPAFASRGGTIGVVWIEGDDVSNRLFFSMLDSVNNKFTFPIVVADNDVLLSDPKVSIAPDGSAIIVWTQSRYEADEVTGSMDIEDLLQGLDVWYAVYEPSSNTIVAKSKIYDPDGEDLPCAKPGITISEQGIALITWLTQDTTGDTDIWYAELENNNGIWYQSTPDIINDLPGNNYSVQVRFIDTMAIAAWITDSDGEDITGGNQIVVSFYDGDEWDASTPITASNSDEIYNELSMDFNRDYGALAYTSTEYTDEGDEVNSIKAEIYYNGQWDQANYFEYSSPDEYIRLPRVSISDMEFAAVSFQTSDIYEEDDEADAGEVHIALKNLNDSNGWEEIDFSEEVAEDTSIYVWDMEVLLSRNNVLYTLSQEQDTVVHELYGGMYTPVNGILFGTPDMGLVLRGTEVNSNLTVNPVPVSSLPETPNGINAESIAGSTLSLLAYPNPASDQITIEYAVAKAGQVSLELYDVLGRKVSTFQEGRLEKGRQSLRCNLGAWGKGVFLLVLRTESGSKSLRIVLQ